MPAVCVVVYIVLCVVLYAMLRGDTCAVCCGVYCVVLRGDTCAVSGDYCVAC